MALTPWLPERTVDAALASALIEEQFFRPARAEPLGEGWDNSVFAVNGEWVFRFPRRQVAVPLLEREARVLPQLKGKLPIPVPLPESIGKPSDKFPWPFAGHRMLAGKTADQAALTPGQRNDMAEPLGAFVKALHAIPLDAGRDAFARMDAAKMRTQTDPRLRDLGVDPPAWFDEPLRKPLKTTLVHGDLHARQLLVLDSALSGVIDWGDVHFGDPACDLAIAFSFFPPEGRAKFLAAYGGADPETLALARLRGLHLAAALGAYAKHLGDAPLLREAMTALDFVRIS